MDRAGRREERLDQVIADYLEALDAGSAPSPDELLARHPDLAEPLRRFLEGHEGVDVALRGVSASSVSSPPPGGDLGDYEITGEIGRGGMATVYEVRDREFNRKLALKMLVEAPESAEDSTRDALRSRFVEEAEITAQLDHPGIVPVYRRGVDADGRAYFTMRLVKGMELGEIFSLARDQKDEWSLPRAIGAIVKACQAVAFAHAKNVIHRDLKPSNIMVGRFGEVYVMDWGLAKVVGKKDFHELRPRSSGRISYTTIQSSRKAEQERSTESPIVTMDGSVVGTPAYMPPEQAKGLVEELDPRSDVYSLGAILYRLLTGRAPYVEPGARISSRTILGMVIQGAPAPIHALSPDAPAELAAICEKAMARVKEDRYPSCLELADDLQAFLDQRVVKAYQTGALAELRSWVARNRATAVSALAAVLILCAGALSIILLQRQANEESNRNLYYSEIARGGSLRASGQYPQLRALLARCPEAFRHWEWSFLKTQLGEWVETTVLESAGRSYGMVLSPDGRRIAFGQDSSVRVLSLETGELVRTLDTDLESVIVFSPEGVQLAIVTGSNGDAVELWDVESGERLRTLNAGSRVRSLIFDAEGRRLATGGEDHAARLWNPETGDQTHVFRSATPVRAVVFTPDGRKLVSGGTDGLVRIWDIESGDEERSLVARAPEISVLAISPDGEKLIVASSSERYQYEETKIWNLKGGWSKDLDLNTELFSVAFSPDSEQIVTGDMVGRIRIWDAERGEELHRLLASGLVRGVAFHPDGAVVALDSLGSVRVWRRGVPAVVHLKGHKAALRAIAFSPDGRWLASAADNVVIWDVEHADALRMYDGHGSSVPALAYSPDGSRVASAGERHALHVWDPLTLRLFWRASLGDRHVWWIDFSPDGRQIVSGSSDGTIQLWDAASGDRIASVEHVTRPGRHVDGVAFSPTGAHVASLAQEGTVKLCSADGLREEWSVLADDAFRCVAFSPDGQWLVNGNQDGTATVRDVVGGALVRTLRGHEAQVNSVVFSGDGKRVFSGSKDGTVRVWDSVTGAELLTLHTSTRSQVWHVALSPDGRIVAASDGDGVITLWKSERPPGAP